MATRFLAALSLSAAGCLMAGGAWGAEWSPLQVDVWSPPFNTERKHRLETYTAQAKADKKWNLCVSIPHLRDSYFMAVNYGIIEEARRQGVAVSIFEAGGYDKSDVQHKQVDACMADKADALILIGVNYEGWDEKVKKFTAAGHPVIDLINLIRSDNVSARVGADFYEMGRLAAEAVMARTSQANVVWMPGPQAAGWAQAGNAGFTETLARGKLKLAGTLWGNTEVGAQTKLLSDFLDKNQDVDFVVGTGVSAEIAVQELRRRKLSDKIKVVSYYFSPNVYRAIERGSIVASPTDVPALQSRLAIDLAIRALEKKPYPKHIGARVQVVDRNNVGNINLRDSLAPDGFRPIFSLDK